MNHISKVGFEIEGGWDGICGVSPFKDISLIADHSINGQTLRDDPINPPHVGEAVSPPLDFLQDDWKGWLEAHWPNATPPHRTNNTCGFHIHLSTLTLKEYSLLTAKSFLFSLRDEILREGKAVKLPKGHEFWKRCSGDNTFCTLQFSTTKQLRITKDTEGIHRERYGWLNFSYGKHNTMEFRALPTFRDSHIAIRFAARYLDFVNSYLDTELASGVNWSLVKNDFGKEPA